MKLNISWVRVLSATQILSAVLFGCVLFFIIKSLGPTIRDSNSYLDKNLSSRKEVILLPQAHLSNQDDCVDVILVRVCEQGVCQNYINSFQVLCKEVLEKENL